MNEQAGNVRTGEELDAHRLFNYLNQNIDGFNEAPEIRQFKGGFSNLTYLLSSGGKEWILRRPPFGSRGGSAHNMEREFMILKMLEPQYSLSPKPILFESDHSIIGSPFFLMERIKGVVVRAGTTLPESMLINSESFYRSLGEKAIDALAELHSLELEGDISSANPMDYTKRQAEGWSRRFRAALTDDAPNPEPVIKWLIDNLPEQHYKAFIHNDFKFDNLVLKEFSTPVVIHGVLDWEMAVTGDPLADLGTTLAYWIEADDSPVLRMFGATLENGNLSREDVIQRYALKSGRDLREINYYYVLGLFKIAGIVQQIYFRYKTGATKDVRFSNLGKVVHACFDKIQELT